MIQPSHQPEHSHITTPKTSSNDILSVRVNGNGVYSHSETQAGDEQLLCVAIVQAMKQAFVSRMDALIGENLEAVRKIQGNMQTLVGDASAKVLAILSRMPAQDRETALKSVVERVAAAQWETALSSNTAS